MLNVEIAHSMGITKHKNWMYQNEPECYCNELEWAKIYQNDTEWRMGQNGMELPVHSGGLSVKGQMI